MIDKRRTFGDSGWRLSSALKTGRVFLISWAAYTISISTAYPQQSAASSYSSTINNHRSNATKTCARVADTCQIFQACCHQHYCGPEVYVYVRCASLGSEFNSQLSFCDCRARPPSPTPPNPQLGPYPNYTQECLAAPAPGGLVANTCEDFEACCNQKPCRAGIERKYECAFYDEDRRIQKSRALCHCQPPAAKIANPTIMTDSAGSPTTGASFWLIHIIVTLVAGALSLRIRYSMSICF